MNNRNEEQKQRSKIDINTPHDRSAGNLKDEEINEAISTVFSQGGDVMATIAEKWMDQGYEKGKWDVVINMLREGLSIDFIAKISGFSADKIKQFKERMQNQKENLAT